MQICTLVKFSAIPTMKEFRTSGHKFKGNQSSNDVKFGEDFGTKMIVPLSAIALTVYENPFCSRDGPEYFLLDILHFSFDMIRKEPLAITCIVRIDILQYEVT